MIVKRDSLVLEVITGTHYELRKTLPKCNREGLLRIFHQYALEQFGEQYADIIPRGVYRVSRTKWLFRPAVYEVHPIGSR